MNFLAHAYLAATTPESLLGSLMGDFLKGVDLARLDPAVRRGVELHLAVDSFTDAHPIVLASKRRISPERRRYAGVIIDMAYDHFLARDWEAYAPLSLDRFAGSVYAVLAQRMGELPEAMQRAMRRMIAHDWLRSYAAVESLEIAFQRISCRLRRENGLGGALADVTATYDELADDFSRFFPELAAFARSFD